MSKYQKAKSVVRSYFDALEKASPVEVLDVMETYITADEYDWRSVYPFRRQNNVKDVAEKFWIPFKQSLTHMQRRQDIFIAGTNEFNDEQWVMSMGNFMGLFDADWLGIPRTRKMANMRYAEFHCVENGKITKTTLHLDIISLMVQAGTYPLPPSTGVYFNYPGPRTHDGLQYEDMPDSAGAKTLALINSMINDLGDANLSGSMTYPADGLRRSWHEDMIWYGPAGIGATYTIPRYQEQHQLPFRENLDDKKFNGHVCRFAEGNYGCFFGWPNLSNRSIGGFLGLPAGADSADMYVVDVYRRDGDKLAENWVFIDLLYWLKQQGLDVLERTQKILNSDR